MTKKERRVFLQVEAVARTMRNFADGQTSVSAVYVSERARGILKILEAIREKSVTGGGDDGSTG